VSNLPEWHQNGSLKIWAKSLKSLLERVKGIEPSYSAWKWRGRAGQARRVAGMLSPRDAALLEAYARECEDCARAGSIECASIIASRANTRLSVDIRRGDDQNFGSLVRGRLPNQAA
jgi:hypothetical protein